MTDQLSLVGMTQGARKRAARLTAFLSAVPKFRFQRRRMLLMFRRDRLGELLADEYRAARARYRIGERLRLCPRLIHRNGEWIGCFCCESRIRRPLPPSGVVISGNLCDGIGVVPVKKKSIDP